MRISQKVYSRTINHILLVLITLTVIIALFAHAPIPQFANYHEFANQHVWMHIPHAENVLTNLPFLFIGLWGLFRINRYAIASKIEYYCWLGFFVSVALTMFGSSFYHLEPNNWRLVWDRIPIVTSFICLFCALLTERVSARFVVFSIFPMLLYSIISVFYWYYTDNLGRGDLRAYILVQLLPIILIPLIVALYPSRYTKSWMLLLVALWYVLAKFCELQDGMIYQLIGFGGHGIKHLFAAMACIQVTLMLEKRTIRLPA